MIQNVEYFRRVGEDFIMEKKNKVANGRTRTKVSES